MSSRIAVRQCQRRLLVLWGSLGGLALLVVLVQITPGGAYASHSQDVLDWFLPTVIPTLSLMVGSVAADARTPDAGATVDRFFYRLVAWVSVAYLVLVIGLLFTYAQSPEPVSGLKQSGKLVTGIYTVVGVAIGALFVSRRGEG